MLFVAQPEHIIDGTSLLFHYLSAFTLEIKDKKKLLEACRPFLLFPFCFYVCAALFPLQTVSSPCLSLTFSLSLSLTSHHAPPSLAFILLVSFSHVLQHPGLPATRLCGEPDRGSPEQRGALGLRQGLQADWERHSSVQEDRPRLLHLGRPGACLPG